jgi:hypothetical protein
MIMNYLLNNNKHFFCIFVATNITVFIQLLKEIIVSFVKLNDANFIQFFDERSIALIYYFVHKRQIFKILIAIT